MGEPDDSVETTEGQELHVAVVRGTVLIQALDTDGDGLGDFQLSPYSAKRLAMLLDEAAGVVSTGGSRGLV